MRNETRDYRDHQKRKLCGKEDTVSRSLDLSRTYRISIHCPTLDSLL